MLEFDSLMDLERLRSLLAAGTGQGVKVAVLDTGVEPDHPGLGGRVRACYEVEGVGPRLVCRPTAGGDAVGHGTACAGIIHRLAPEADLYSVRVIGKSAVGTTEQLLAGLSWAIEQEVDVVNLSLGTTSPRFAQALHELSDQAAFAGLILVAAANNRGIPAYPAKFASTIAVENEWFADPLQYYYRVGQVTELQAHGIYVHAPTLNGKYQMWTGTSFACPHITGIVARLRSQVAGLTSFQARSLLWCLRSRAPTGAAPANKPA
jgi:subtilisin family serine protease